MPAMTVLLPVHNGRDYLEQSLASVLAQRDVDFDVHIYCTGDRSPEEFVERWADERVKVNRCDESTGLFAKLNRGLRDATGEWVKLWGHDDVMYPGAMAAFAGASAAHSGAGMLYCDFVAIDSSGRRTYTEASYRTQRRRTTPVMGPNEAALLFWTYGCAPGNISTVMVRREAALACGGFREDFRIAADFLLWADLSARFPVAYISTPLVEIRDHANQASKTDNRGFVTIFEEAVVFDGLRRRLGFVDPADLEGQWEQGRGQQFARWMVRAALRGQLTSLRSGWSGLGRYGAKSRRAALLAPLLTLNGRLLSHSREAVFDRWADEARQRDRAAAKGTA